MRLYYLDNAQHCNCKCIGVALQSKDFPFAAIFCWPQALGSLLGIFVLDVIWMLTTAMEKVNEVLV